MKLIVENPFMCEVNMVSETKDSKFYSVRWHFFQKDSLIKELMTFNHCLVHTNTIDLLLLSHFPHYTMSFLKAGSFLIHFYELN